MTLADDCTPVDCIEIVSGEITENVVLLSKNLPKDNDTMEELAQKYSKIEYYLNKIREYTKEGLKARRYGSDFVAQNLTINQKHRSLSDFEKEDSTVEVSINGGSTVKTTMAGFERAAKLAQDPDAVNRILDGE